MSEQEQNKFVVNIKNQVLTIVVGASLTGLLMVYTFMITFKDTMTNFKDTMQHTNENVNLKFMAVDKQFDKIELRFNKVEDKVDGIYKFNVPENSQVQEPRKKDPNF
jgi:hypothetical protein